MSELTLREQIQNIKEFVANHVNDYNSAIHRHELAIANLEENNKALIRGHEYLVNFLEKKLNVQWDTGEIKTDSPVENLSQDESVSGITAPTEEEVTRTERIIFDLDSATWRLGEFFVEVWLEPYVMVKPGHNISNIAIYITSDPKMQEYAEYQRMSFYSYKSISFGEHIPAKSWKEAIDNLFENKKIVEEKIGFKIGMQSIVDSISLHNNFMSRLNGTDSGDEAWKL